MNGRCRIYGSSLPLLCCLYGFLYIHQVYVLVFLYWFATFAAGYVVVFTSVVVFYIQNPCLCFKYGKGFHSSLFIYVFLIPGFLVCCLVDIVFWFFLLLLRLSCQQFGFDVHSYYGFCLLLAYN